MPVNFQHIQGQIREMGAQLPQRLEKLEQRRLEARRLFEDYAADLDGLGQRLAQALQTNQNLRCAIPALERLDFAHTPVDAPLPRVILAADGSQVNPDRHAAVEFGVINIGVFRMVLADDAVPSERVESRLLGDQELYTDQGMIGEEVVALMRDYEERAALLRLAKDEAAPVVTLTDGPLELFREPRSQQRYQEYFQKYLGTLQDMASHRILCAGYVDRPRADLLVRLLELAHPLYKPEINGARPLRGISDALLFQDVLQPGQRSAVFGIQSRSAASFTGEIALHFFYLNLGRPDMPAMARVEIPAWLAADAAQLDLLHAVIASQSAQLGARPYPYVLHRAHEIAVVTYDEHRQLESMIQYEMMRNGIPLQTSSHKQFHKDHSGDRTRYQS
ncbi:MAG: DNA double-strand break repair nuclease NurA [Anaerolineae bacterium]|jgi:hypothetical protein|nr:DNA double-strand break repair nuclease NurA [Anaerolineae bacterium]